MVVLILAFLASLLPSLALYFWMKRFKNDEAYRKNCRDAMIKGLLCVFPVLGLSALFALLKNLLFKNADPLIYAAVHTFIVLALAEEIAKYLAGRKIIDQAGDSVSWLDVIVFMGIVGIGFGLAEDIPYAIGASVPIMLVRGATVSHGVYGMICGYFLGKGFKAGKDPGMFSILVPLLYHGLYDFGLDDNVLALGEDMALLSVGLAFGELVLLIVFIVFFIKARKNEKYTAPLFRKTEQA